MKLIKLDGRMNGHRHFKYGVDFSYDKSDKYAKVWYWMNEQYGPSIDLDIWIKYAEFRKNPKWSWDRSQSRTVIYLLSDEESNWFSLKWIT